MQATRLLAGLPERAACGTCEADELPLKQQQQQQSYPVVAAVATFLGSVAC